MEELLNEKKIVFKFYRKPVVNRRLCLGMQEFRKKIIMPCCKIELSRNFKTPFFYDPRIRVYALDIGNNNIQLMLFCSWCGKKLPKALINKWYILLLKEYKIKDPFMEERNNPNFPEEFKTDEWWKKRRL